MEKVSERISRSGKLRRKFAEPLSQKSYVKGFETFTRISSEYASMMRWIRSTLCRRFPGKNALSVLSIGSGSGNFDLRLVETFREKFNRLRYTALEPDKAQCKRFEKTAAASPDRNVRFKFHATPFEKFRTRKRFDLIHLTHCLYYMPNREQVLLQAYKLLAKHGRIIIFHQTPLGINQIQRRFLKRVKGNEKEMFSSRELQGLLDRLSLPYELETIESFLDITDHFEFNSGPSLDLLSFFLESNAGQIPPRKKKIIIDYIRSITHFIQGRRLLFHPVAIFSLSKE